MEPVGQLLRRLALNDEILIGSVLASGSPQSPASSLDRKAEALVQAGALLSVGASTASLRWIVEVAQSTGATDEEIFGVLVAIGPAVGLAARGGRGAEARAGDGLRDRGRGLRRRRRGQATVSTRNENAAAVLAPGSTHTSPSWVRSASTGAVMGSKQMTACSRGAKICAKG